MHMHSGERRSHVRTFEMVETDKLRRRMEGAVETLLAALDALEGDPDLEDGHDAEDVCEDEGADDEREPEREF